MKLTIIDVNFSNDKDWLFKLKNQENIIYYIFASDIYQDNFLRIPISKKHLDYYDKGLIIDAEVQKIGDKNFVVSILEQLNR